MQIQTGATLLMLFIGVVFLSSAVNAQSDDRQAAMDTRIKGHAAELTQNMQALYQLDDRQTRSLQRLNENYQRKLFEGSMEQQQLMTSLRSASDEERAGIQKQINESRMEAAEQRRKHDRDYMHSLRRILNDTQIAQLEERQMYNLDIYKDSVDDEKKIEAKKHQKAEAAERRAQMKERKKLEAEEARKQRDLDRRKREGGR